MMNTKKTLPVLAALAALAIGSGTFIATAQDTGVETAGVEAEYDRERKGGRHHRGERHGDRHAKGHHRGGRHGRGGGPRGMMMEMFRQADADGNRELTRAEIDTFRAAQVGGADASGDGALSLEEFDTLYSQMTRTRMVRAFQRLDRDGDGTIAPEEMDRPIERMIRRMDRDGDGILTIEDRKRGKRG